MAENKTTRARRKEWAKSLYTRDHLTIIEIAEQVGVERRTVSRWIKEEGWDKLRTGILMTRETQLLNLYEGIDRLNEQRLLRPEGERGWTTGESATIVNITKSIERLQMQSGIAETISVFTDLLSWLREQDPEKAKSLAILLDNYVKHKSI